MNRERYELKDGGAKGRSREKIYPDSCDLISSTNRKFHNACTATLRTFVVLLPVVCHSAGVPGSRGPPREQTAACPFRCLISTSKGLLWQHCLPPYIAYVEATPKYK